MNFRESDMLKNIVRRYLRTSYEIAINFGIDPLQFMQAVRNVPRFLRDYFVYARASRGDQRFPLRMWKVRPRLHNFREEAGGARGHYFWQDLWAARKIYERRPSHHVDVGFRIDGFVAHLLIFMPVTVVDIRPLSSNVPGLTFIQDDGTTLKSIPDNSIESLSSLHAVEHFGLGRYGDPVDPDACFKAMSALARVLKPGGRLYFSVPIGRERLEFNAQRVFSPRTIWWVFKKKLGLDIVSFSAVDDDGNFHEEANPEDFVHAYYSLGLWEFTKRE